MAEETVMALIIGFLLGVFFVIICLPRIFKATMRVAIRRIVLDEILMRDTFRSLIADEIDRARWGDLL